MRWILAIFLCFLAPCFFYLGVFLLVAWTAEPELPSTGTVKFIMTLGFACLALAPCSLAGAIYVIWSFKKKVEREKKL